MKKHLLGMIMAGAAVISACEADVQPVQIEFTASLGKDIKTYLDYNTDTEVYKTKWASGDEITILALQEDQTYKSTQSSLVSGAGTTEGTFLGSLSGSYYIGYYGMYSDKSDFTTGVIYPVFAQYQYDRKINHNDGTSSFDNNIFPMYAEGNSNHLEFKNLGAVLKISLLGKDYIDNIVVNANVPISGTAVIIPANSDAPLHTSMLDDLSQNSLTYYLRDHLSETEARDCYIVVPALSASCNSCLHL